MYRPWHACRERRSQMYFGFVGTVGDYGPDVIVAIAFGQMAESGITADVNNFFIH